MKRWTRVFMALVITICALVVGSIAATPDAHAVSSQEMWVDCSVYFHDGPNQGQTEPVSFLTTSSGGLTAYSSDYVGGQSDPGSWFVNGSNTTGLTFSTPLAIIPGTTLTVNASFTDNTYPVSADGTGTIVDSNGQVIVVTHTTTTCAYFIPGTSYCLITYAMSQWTGNFTATITIANTGTNAIPSGGTMIFLFPGTQTITTWWNAAFSQSGNTITVTHLRTIAGNNQISIGFNGAWSGSNPNPVKYSLNGTPCTVNV